MSVTTAHLYVHMTVYNTALNRSDNLPSYPSDNLQSSPIMMSKGSRVKGPDIYILSPSGKPSSSGLQIEVRYSPALALHSAAQLAADRRPKERTLTLYSYFSLPL